MDALHFLSKGEHEVHGPCLASFCLSGKAASVEAASKEPSAAAGLGTPAPCPPPQLPPSDPPAQI